MKLRFQIKKDLLIGISIAILTTLIYANSLRGEFVCDDGPLIFNNEKIKSVSYLPEYFIKSEWELSELQYADGLFYRPIHLISNLIDFSIWGANPLGFHISNLFIHIVNSILLFLLLTKLLHKNYIPIIMGSIIFAVHPVHVESVSWISGRTDLLMTFFFLCSFILLIKYREVGKYSLLFLSLIFYFLSLISKEVAITFPLILIVFDYTTKKKFHIKQLGCFISITLIYIILRTYSVGWMSDTFQFSFSGIKQMLEFALSYIKLLVAPWPLNFYLSVPENSVIGLMGIIFSAILIIITLIYAINNNIILFSSLFLFITLIPSLSLAFHLTPAFAIRYLYLPSVGFVITVSALIANLINKHKKTTLFLLTIITIVFGSITIRANMDWRNDGIFYSKAIKTTPKYSGSYLGLARYFEKKGKTDEAINIYKVALDYVSSKKDREILYTNFASVLGKRGDYKLGITYFEKALVLNPNSSHALVGLGNIFLFKKDYLKALDYYSEAYKADSNNYAAVYNLALIHNLLGNEVNSSYYYKIFLMIAPKDRYPDVDRAMELSN